jgi:hypothetical protein
LKKNGLNADNVGWFADAIGMGDVKHKEKDTFDIDIVIAI